MHRILKKAPCAVLLKINFDAVRFVTKSGGNTTIEHVDTPTSELHLFSRDPRLSDLLVLRGRYVMHYQTLNV